jgi:hypothetical protein
MRRTRDAAFTRWPNAKRSDSELRMGDYPISAHAAIEKVTLT